MSLKNRIIPERDITLNQNQRLYFLCTHTSPSNMTGFYRVFTATADQRIIDITFDICAVTGEKYWYTDNDEYGIRVNGCGLDRRLEIVEELHRTMVKRGEWTGKLVQSIIDDL